MIVATIGIQVPRRKVEEHVAANLEIGADEDGLLFKQTNNALDAFIIFSTAYYTAYMVALEDVANTVTGLGSGRRDNARAHARFGETWLMLQTTSHNTGFTVDPKGLKGKHTYVLLIPLGSVAIHPLRG